MSKQVSRQRASTKHLTSSKNKPNSSTEQGEQLPRRPNPITDNHVTDLAYMQVTSHPWRTAPEIDEERKKELTSCLDKEPDVEQGIYPFKGVKLSRADVEWLLVTHKDIDRQGKKHRRKGLDLRGANLRGENLSNLPLNNLFGGLYWVE